MKIYQIKLKYKSNLITSLQGDTIFGHLCWVVAHKEGDKGIKDFLKPFMEHNPPFILSDGFPGDLLPRPSSAEFNIKDVEVIKEIKKIEYVSLTDFNRIRNGEAFKPDVPAKHPIRLITTPHNRVDRLTNTVGEDSLYSLQEMHVDYVSLFLKVVDDKWKERVVDLLKELSKSGYGRKKSIGKGQFTIEGVEEFNKFEPVSQPDGFVTLSNFCPAEDDPVEGLYRTFVKYGKLGEEFTFCGNPFKKPLVMIKAGSVFKTGEPPEEFYGRMIPGGKDGVSPVKEEVVQYAYAFALPIQYPRI
jgi:CRISPR-associated protein Csm4